MVSIFLGKVIYSNETKSCELLKAFIDFHNAFVNQHPSFTDNIPTIIPTFLLFHKNPIWSVEKEHRLFTYLQFDNDFLELHGYASNFHLEDYLCHSFGINKKEIAYVRMPLQPYSDVDFAKYRLKDEKKFLKTKPNITISKVILGYNYTEKQTEEIGYLIYKLSTKVLKKFIATELSPLSKYL